MKRRIHQLILPFIIGILGWCTANLHWGGERWKQVIISDGKGYYAYLPAVFIYHDLNLGFYDEIEARYYDANTRSDYRSSWNGKIINKYFAGTALALLPFFSVAHGLSLLTGEPADGWSVYYAVLVSIGAIFWLAIGLIFTRRLLLTYIREEVVISICLPALVFGTNLFYYVLREPSMSHVYSFAFAAAFLYQCRNFFLQPAAKTMYLAALSLGMILLIRPVNGLMVFCLPFLAGNSAALKQGLDFLKQNKKVMLICLFACSTLCSIQLFLYKASTGNFFADAYNKEGFNWGEPHLLDFLFSYKKGFLVYCPLFLLSLMGIATLFRDRFRLFSAAAFLFLAVYVLSSWWQWYYGGSFGSRVMIEYYPFLVILMALALRSVWEKRSRILVCAFVFATVLLCQVQTFQYRYYHIHWALMDKEHYWRAFMRIDLLAKGENPNADLLK